MVGVEDFDIIFIMLGLGLIIGAVVVAMFFSNHCKDKEPPQQVCEDGSEFQNRWYEKRWFWGFIIPGVFFLIMGIIASVQGWGSGTKKAYASAKDSTKKAYASAKDSALKKVESSNIAPMALKEAAVNKRTADVTNAAKEAGPSVSGQGGKRRYKGKK